VRSYGGAREYYYKILDRIIIGIALFVFLSLCALAGCYCGKYQEAEYKRKLEEVEIYTRLWTAEDVGIEKEYFDDTKKH